MTEWNVFSGWNSPPNGGARYRIRFTVRLEGQNVDANTSDLYWSFMLEKDRSFNGFYGYSASWGASIGGVPVILAGGIGPSYAWPSWDVYEIGSGRLTVAHDADGTKNGLVLQAEYQGANSGWAIGTTGLTQSIGLPTIPRATIPTVTPSPATVASNVVIDLPRKVSSYTHDVSWTSGSLGGTIGTGIGGVENIAPNPSFEASSGFYEYRRNLHPNPRGASLTGWAVTAAASSGITLATVSTGGPSGVVDSFVRGTLASSPTGSPVVIAPISFGTSGIPAAANTTYSISMYIRRSDNAGNDKATRFDLLQYTAGGVLIGSSQAVGSASGGGTGWGRRTATFTTAATTAFITIRAAFSAGSTAPIAPGGTTYDVTGVQVEEWASVTPFFCGDTATSGDFTYAPVGTLNASASIERVRIADGISWASGYSYVIAFQSGAWAANGSNSLRMRRRETGGSFYASNYALLGPSKTYTVMVKSRATTSQALSWPLQMREGASPNRIFATLAASGTVVNGVQEWRATFTTPSDHYGATWLDMSAGPAVGDEVWWDDFAVVEVPNIDTPYTGPFFIGTSTSNGQTSITWPVPNVMGEFPGKTSAPIVIKVVTKSGATVIGTRQVTLFARSAPQVVGEYSRDPSKQFDVRARLVTFSGGTWGPTRSVPVSELKMVDSASATATCNLSVSTLVTAFSEDSIVDIDVYNGTDWIYTNHRFVLSRSEGDDIDPAKTKSYSGTEFIDYELAHAYTQEDIAWDGTNDPATAHWPLATPGEIMKYFIDSATIRGWGPRISFEFDATKTSLGETWANPQIDRSYSKGTPLSQVLNGLVEDGIVEYRTEYRNNRAYLVLLNPGTGMNYATDGAAPLVNLALAKLARAPRRNTSENRLTSVTVAGDDDIKMTRTMAPFDADVFGRVEGWVSASGVKTNEAAGTIGDNALRDNGVKTSERTFEFSANGVAPQFYPYNVFVPGDWIKIPDGDNSLQDRINQITIDKGADGTRVTVLTGDRILSGPASLAKRQSAQTGGAIAGGNQNTPAPLDSRIPAEVSVTSVTSVGYWSVDGTPQSKVTLSWAQVTTAMNGSAINVDLYEVFWRDALSAGEWAFRSATDQLTIDIPGWDIADELEFRVRARSTAGIYGQFSANESHTTAAPAVDLDGPIIADIYTDGVGSIYVVWAGLLGTDPYPLRMAYVIAEISDDSGATWSTVGTPLAGPGTLILNPGTYGSFDVRLRAYDKLGNPGDASDIETIVTTDPTLIAPIPTAPTSLAASPGSGWAENGIVPEAWFDLIWTPPTVDMEGNPITVVGYDIWGKLDSEVDLRFITSSTTPSVRVNVGFGETWSFQVRATSEFGGVSALSTAIIDTADAPIAPPGAPDAPTLDQYAGLLRIRWSGNGMVSQIKYAFASISTSSGGAFTRAGMPLQGAGEVVVPGLATDTNYWVKINLVDEIGQIVSSAQAGPIHLLPITGVTIQTSELSNTGIKMTNAALTSYDVSGNPTFILDAITGEVWIAPYDAVFEFGALGNTAETGAAVVGLAISSDNSSFNTFFHPSGMQIRNDQTPISWWEADAADANLVNFVSPRARIDSRLQIGDYEALKEAKTLGTRLVFRYKGA